jgi:spore coat polysaccharide biosynthesis protein SpsF (cytidylyltransferase family)
MYGIKTARGPVDDIIGRLCNTISTNDELLVRVWGDCPFIDPTIIDAMLAQFEREQLDFMNVGGIEQRSLPMGLDVEIYRVTLLQQMNAEVADMKLREFPYEYIKRNPHLRTAIYQGPSPALSSLYVTIDYPEDLDAARLLYAALGKLDNPMKLESLLSVVEGNPLILKMFSTKGRNIEYKAFIREQAAQGSIS